MSTRTQAALLIDTHHPFPEPLIPDGTPKETDTTALQAAITAWERSGRPDSLGDMEAFLDQHPQSAWSLALQANLGILCASQAQFGKALDWLERTFVAGEAATAVNLRRLMDRVLGELLHLHARLGSVESLDRWLQEADRRALQGSAFQYRSEARMALWSLRNQTAVFRAYDPRAGRWINRDPIGEDGGVNLYEYSKNEPTNNNDSLGLSPNLSGFAKYELHKAIKFCAQPKNWISKELVSQVPGLQCFSELILAGQNEKRTRQECIAASKNPKSRFYGHPQSCEIIRPYSTFEGCIKFASTYGIADSSGK